MSTWRAGGCGSAAPGEPKALELELLSSEEPSATHVRISYQLRHRLFALRRCAWDSRQLVQELWQDQWNVITSRSKKLLKSVERVSSISLQII